jgi:hypothetical protein
LCILVITRLEGSQVQRKEVHSYFGKCMAELIQQPVGKIFPSLEAALTEQILVQSANSRGPLAFPWG